jgi:hypothetical protein
MYPGKTHVTLLPKWETLEIYAELSLKCLKGGGHLGMDQCGLLKLVLEKSGLKFRTQGGFPLSRFVLVKGFCDHCYELSGSLIGTHLDELFGHKFLSP